MFCWPSVFGVKKSCCCCAVPWCSTIKLWNWRPLIIPVQCSQAGWVSYPYQSPIFLPKLGPEEPVGWDLERSIHILNNWLNLMNFRWPMQSHDSWCTPRTQTEVWFVRTRIWTLEADHAHRYSPYGSGLPYPNRRHPHWLAQTDWIEIHSAAVNLSDRLITTFPMDATNLRDRKVTSICLLQQIVTLLRWSAVTIQGASTRPPGVWTQAVPNFKLLTSFIQYFTLFWFF
jgi:hypothetical protein